MASFGGAGAEKSGSTEPIVGLGCTWELKADETAEAVVGSAAPRRSRGE